ncbi:MAG: DUF2927 domain-containing protein, partial [Pseudomonadota bacterium]
RARKRSWIAAGLAFFALLAGCELFVPVEPVLTPQARPQGLGIARPSPQPTSVASAALRRDLTEVQSSQLTQGLLRQDGGGPDTPFTGEMLARNFEQIVFFNEFGSGGFGLPRSSPLRRWEGPVRINAVFGSSVTQAQARQDLSDINRYTARLARATGHPIVVGSRPNVLVLFVSEDERASLLETQATQIAGVSDSGLRRLRDLPRDVYCAVAAFGSAENPNAYVAAVVVIRDENPDLLRLSCIHEELAQSLGLANDSPNARPSIFNDDDEFALLTTHDEMLLGMLYDKRLEPGITLEEARPLVRVLASERMGGPS